MLKVFSETKHYPPGLLPLLATVAGSRFSAYGLKTLLVLYIVNVLGLSLTKTGQYFGVFDGLLFMSPLLGGYLADRFFGHRKSVLAGCILMTIGQCLLYKASLVFLFSGLLLFMLGSGLFDPGVTVLLGRLYPKDIKLKERGYMLYMVAVNFGSMLATFICAWIAMIHSWGMAFLVSSLGTILGIILSICVKVPDRQTQSEHVENIKQHTPAPLTSADWERIRIILTLAFFMVLYFLAYDQGLTTLMIFADRYTDRHIFGYEFPAQFFQVIDPAFIIIIGLLFAPFFKSLKERKASSEISRIMFGMILLAFCFVIVALGSFISLDESLAVKLNPLWLFVAIFMTVLSQLFIFPIALSLVNTLSPPGRVGFMMGLWTFSYGIGSYLAGAVTGFMGETVAEIRAFFFIQALICIMTVLLLFAIRKKLQGKIDKHIQPSVLAQASA